MRSGGNLTFLGLTLWISFFVGTGMLHGRVRRMIWTCFLEHARHLWQQCAHSCLNPTRCRSWGWGHSGNLARPDLALSTSVSTRSGCQRTADGSTLLPTATSHRSMMPLSITHWMLRLCHKCNAAEAGSL
ncbi:uncharacterized protein EI90DRAFT_3036514 [Cantharellus anzutake]|uniref:uncharacterized protein n=1 Tax=Cantharellus anzutake TaxID=1750568 RepID=UPI001905F08B|nr:uncharacterized protein EI90DRAFT_3036514 [Cantharellus anzutake]KAF8340697.1 hypothetical protein EI90DRAFT_3036514 [Cantharellus anzutake]